MMSAILCYMLFAVAGARTLRRQGNQRVLSATGHRATPNPLCKDMPAAMPAALNKDLPRHASCALTAELFGKAGDGESWTPCLNPDKETECVWFCPATVKTLPQPKGICPALDPTKDEPVEPNPGKGGHTPKPCFDSERGDSAEHSKVSVLPPDDTCDDKKLAHLPKNYVVCPSLSTNGKCSYYCPTTMITANEGEHLPACDLPTAEVKKAPSHNYKVTLAKSLCMQIDIKTLGSFLELNFGVGGTLTFTKGSDDFNTLAFTGMLGGGATAGALLLKASLFIQGEVELTGSVPKIIHQPINALKWLLSSVWRELMGETALGRFSAWVARKTGTSSDGSTAIDKIMKFSKALRWMAETAQLKKDDAAEEAGGDNKAKQTVKQGMEAAKKSKVSQQATDETEKTKTKTLLESANFLLIEFIKLWRKQASGMLTKVQDAKDSSKAGVEYLQDVQRIWTKIYLGDDRELSEIEDMRTTLFRNKRLKCSKITVSTEKNNFFAPLMCTFAKNGMIIPKHDWNSRVYRTKLNVLKSLPLLYPELFPGFSWDGDSTNTITVDRDLLADLLKNTTPMDDGDDLLDFPAKFESKTNMFAAGLHPILSLPPDQIKKVLHDHYNMKQRRDDACLMKCKCGMRKLELVGLVGLTVGTSSVGFCTPDTNPVQINRVRKRIWTWERSSSKCQMTAQAKEKVTTVTFSIGPWLALDLKWERSEKDEQKEIKRTPTTVQVRVRGQTEDTLASPPDKPPDEFAQQVAEWIELLLGKLKLPSTIKVFSAAAKGIGEGGNLKKLDDILTTSKLPFFEVLAAGFHKMVNVNQLTAMASAIAKAGHIDVEVKKTTFTGFNVLVNFKEKKLQLSLEQLVSTGASVTAPTGVGGIDIGVGVYLSSLENFEYTFDKGGPVIKEMNKLYKRVEMGVSAAGASEELKPQKVPPSAPTGKLSDLGSSDFDENGKGQPGVQQVKETIVKKG